MDYSRANLANALAAEYASGLLRGSARRRFEALLPAHPTWTRAVRAWEDRLMPLTAVVAPVAPSAAVWARIEARIHGACHITVLLLEMLRLQEHSLSPHYFVMPSHVDPSWCFLRDRADRCTAQVRDTTCRTRLRHGRPG